jgi:hypothetical protein
VTKKYVCGSLYDEEKRLWQNVCGKTFVAKRLWNLAKYAFFISPFIQANQ